MTAVFSGLVNFIGGHPFLAILVVFLVAAGEATFVVGLFIPSTVVLIGVGTLIGMGQLSFWPILIASSLGATAGDSLSYWVGHIYTDRLRTVWPFSRYRALVDYGERFFLRHGGKSIFVSRFLPGVKAVVPIIAGMLGMGVVRFTVINALSGIAWSAAHILPAMVLGRGISVYGTGNPRLIALILIVLALILATWYLIRVSIIWLGPGVVRLHRASVQTLATSESAPLRFVHRLLTNEGGTVVAVAWSAVGLVAVSGFVALVFNLLFEPELTAADHAISNLVQSFRNGPGDAAVVAITMAGDGFVLTAVAAALLVGLAVSRRWRVAAVAALGIASASAFVPLLKSILQRPRPTALYSGAEAFSFPSGHATLSATILGLVAVILAQDRPRRMQFAVYATTVAVVVAIAASRVYLGAHWPSDVTAGLLFGTALVSLLAFFIRRAPPLPTRRIAVWVGVAFLAAYPAHLLRSYAAAEIAYAPQRQTQTISQSAWLASGWQSLPARRIELDGETGEPFDMQTDLPPTELIAVLEKAGWRTFTSPTMVEALVALVPSPMPFGDQMPLPDFHDGRAAALVFAKPSPDDSTRRFLLRLWDSGTDVGSQAAASPIMLGALAAEAEEPFAFGLVGVEPAELTTAERTALTTELDSAFHSSPNIDVMPVGPTLLLVAKR